MTRGKAAVNAPLSKRFARCGDARWLRQRLECGDFSTAFRGRFPRWYIDFNYGTKLNCPKPVSPYPSRPTLLCDDKTISTFNFGRPGFRRFDFIA
jgi:hypothetical protein